LRSLALSPDGQSLAALGEDIRLLDARTLKEQCRLTPPHHTGWLGDAHLLFDRTGEHLMVHTALGSVARWHLGALKKHLHAE
jgi:WD40 repeat protein